MSVENGKAGLLVLIGTRRTGVIINGVFAAANANFAPNDTRVTEDVARPTLPERSGSPQSLSSWDSLAHVNFVPALEQQFAIQFLPEEMLEMLSIELVAMIVSEKLSQKGDDH